MKRTLLTTLISLGGVAPFALAQSPDAANSATPFVSNESSALMTAPQPFTISGPLMLSDATTAAAELEKAAGSQAELAKKTLNPVADLISLPFQFNVDFGIGDKNATRTTLNIQPVIPIGICQDWNLIIRTIVPLIYAESAFDGMDSKFGMGDVVQSFFFSPKQPVGGWILAAGPVFLWPTATDDSLGSEKWGIGPTAVALLQEHGWTYGILANHIWSYAGDSDRQSVNATFLQPFLSYTFPTFTSIGLNTESTYDWANSQWTVPINLSVTQILKIGKLPVSAQLGGRYYADGPDGCPDWGLRFTFTFLFPK